MPQCYNSGWFSKIWLSQKRLKCTESYKLGCSACLLQNTFCNEKKYILRNVQKIQVGVGRYNLPVSPRRPPPVLPLQMELADTQTGISKIFRYWQKEDLKARQIAEIVKYFLVSPCASSYCLFGWGVTLVASVQTGDTCGIVQFVYRANLPLTRSRTSPYWTLLMPRTLLAFN